MSEDLKDIPEDDPRRFNFQDEPLTPEEQEAISKINVEDLFLGVGYRVSARGKRFEKLPYTAAVLHFGLDDTIQELGRRLAKMDDKELFELSEKTRFLQSRHKRGFLPIDLDALSELRHLIARERSLRQTPMEDLYLRWGQAIEARGKRFQKLPPEAAAARLTIEEVIERITTWLPRLSDNDFQKWYEKLLFLDSDYRGIFINQAERTQRMLGYAVKRGKLLDAMVCEQSRREQEKTVETDSSPETVAASIIATTREELKKTVRKKK